MSVTWLYRHKHTDTDTYTDTYTHAHTQAHAHTHKHTHKHTPSLPPIRPFFFEQQKHLCDCADNCVNNFVLDGSEHERCVGDGEQCLSSRHKHAALSNLLHLNHGNNVPVPDRDEARARNDRENVCMCVCVSGGLVCVRRWRWQKGAVAWAGAGLTGQCILTRRPGTVSV